MPVSMLGNLPKQQIKGAVFNCVNLNKWWENLYFKLTPSERWSFNYDEVRWVKMFCFDSPIKCKRAPSVEKILKSFHVDNTCSRRYNCSCIYAFNTCVLKTWTKLIIVLVKSSFAYITSQSNGKSWTIFMKNESRPRLQTPAPGYRIRLWVAAPSLEAPGSAWFMRAQPRPGVWKNLWVKILNKI